MLRLLARPGHEAWRRTLTAIEATADINGSLSVWGPKADVCQHGHEGLMLTQSGSSLAVSFSVDCLDNSW